nr:Stf0 family sulfotransferase [Ruegeria atlantica]
MAATGCAEKPDSYFHAPTLEEWMAYYDLDRTAFPGTKSTLRAIFAEAIHQGKAGTDIFGLRLQGKSRAFFLQQLRTLYPTAGDNLARLKPPLVRSASFTLIAATSWNRLFRL